FLLTTDLTDREIVFGRSVGRIVVGLLTGLVVLPLVVWLLAAGIDIRLFLLGYGLLGTMVVSNFVVALWAAVRSANPAQAQRRAAITISVLYFAPVPLSVVLRWPAAAAWPGPPPFTLGNLTEVLTAGNPMVLMIRIQFLLVGGGSIGDLLWDTLPGWAAFHLTLTAAAGLLAVRSLRPYSALYIDGPPRRSFLGTMR